jgi:hypothetical protein
MQDRSDRLSALGIIHRFDDEGLRKQYERRWLSGTLHAQRVLLEAGLGTFQYPKQWGQLTQELDEHIAGRCHRKARVADRAVDC